MGALDMNDDRCMTRPHLAGSRWHFEGLADDAGALTPQARNLPTVWCYQPRQWTPDSDVLVVMHGVNRNARRCRDMWRTYADRRNALLLAPEFSACHYPGTRAYTLGNLHRKAPHAGGQPFLNYRKIEHIFDAARARLRLNANAYMIYGHSAGAQFVHRLLLFVPDARVSLAICANAGWYTMPLLDGPTFPYGLKGSGISVADLARTFEKKLILWLGDRDTDPHHKHLQRSSQARAQGKHRFERGLRFYHAACETAARLGLPFNWELRIASGVGHSNRRMAKTAMRFLRAL
jgi:hypothetical protein